MNVLQELESYGIPRDVLRRNFISRYRRILGKEFSEFFRYLAHLPRRSLRVNPMKAVTDEEITFLESERFRLIRIPWYEHGFWILSGPERPGNTISHKLGLIYLQEAASMIPPVVLDPQPGERILDISAAPGSKTTQMSEMMRWRGTIVANDVSLPRIKVLVSNIQRMSSLNVIVTRVDGRYAHKVFGECSFDRVLVDAPCSAIGQVRRSWEALKRWSLRAVKRISHLQKSLVLSAYRCLRKGGLLVYSTCTFDPEENEFVVQTLVDLGCEVLKPDVDGLRFREGLTEWEGSRLDQSIRRTMRIYPHHNDTEGFYVALVKKE